MSLRGGIERCSRNITLFGENFDHWERCFHSPSHGSLEASVLSNCYCVIQKDQGRLVVARHISLRGRVFAPLVIVAGLIYLAWSGRSDALTLSYLDESLIKATLLNASIIGIDVLISVLQGTEIDAFFLTLSVGEWLEPMDDVIEQMSSIALLSLSSLFFMKILMSLVGHDAVNLLLTLSGLAYLAFYVLDLPSFRRRALVILVFLVGLRFSLAIALGFVGLIDTTVLSEREAASVDRVSQMQEDLGGLAGALNTNSPSAVSLDQINEQLQAANREYEEVSALLQSLQAELTSIEQQQSTLCGLAPVFMCYETLSDSGQGRFDQLLLDLASTKLEIETLEPRLDVIDGKITSLTAERDCALAMQAGDACEEEWKLPSWSIGDFKEKVGAIATKTEDLVVDAGVLMASLVLKTIVLPILFVTAFFAFIRWAARAFTKELE